jgi:hypothetical protein
MARDAIHHHSDQPPGKRGSLVERCWRPGVTNPQLVFIDDTFKPPVVVMQHFGLDKIASEEIIGRFGKTDFVTRTFDSVDEALKWVAGIEEQIKLRAR